MGAAILRQPAIAAASLAYRAGVANYCPACVGTNWLVGRHVAECGRCGFVLVLAPNGRMEARRG